MSQNSSTKLTSYEELFQAVSTNKARNVQNAAGFPRLLKQMASSALVVMSVGVGSASFAQDKDREEAVEATPQSRLIEQARYWKERGRPDLAEQSLKRLLDADPKNVHAIFEMARVMLVKGDNQSAQTYLGQLKTLVGSGGLYEQLRQEIDIATLDRKALNQARALVKKGDFETALRVYDRTLAGRELAGELAIEYYETMAGLEARWDEARDGLRTLIETSPDADRARLALARVETYRPNTRRAGIVEMLTLAEADIYREDALDAAKQAMTWLSISDDDEDLISQYMALRPGDDEVLAFIDEIDNPTPQSKRASAIAQGYAYLNSDRVLEAYDIFEGLVELDRKDVDALAGLGIVQIRMGEYAEAEDLLKRAMELSDDDEQITDFSKALKSARFGSEMEHIRRALSAEDYVTAASLADDLKPNNARDRAQIASVNAQIAMARGDEIGAERSFREALDLNSADEYAFSGLLNVLIDQKKMDQLATSLATYADIKPSTDHGKGALARARGALAEERGDMSTAIEQYLTAIEYLPKDPWLHLNAARALRTVGKTQEADMLMSKADNTSNPSMAYAGALFAHEDRNWATAQRRIVQIPENQHTSDMRRLVEHSRIQMGVDRSLLVASTGDVVSARRGLLDLYTPGKASAEETLLIGSALLEIGDKQTAASLIRQGLQMRRDATVAELTAGAQLLIAADSNEAAQSIIAKMEPLAFKMDQAERLELASVHDDLTVARARTALESGDVGTAIELVASVHDANPVHSGALRLLGQINLQSSRKEAGLNFYKSALDLDPTDINALNGAVGALIELRDYSEAHRLIDDTMLWSDHASDLYELKSSVYRAAGNHRKALEALEDARTSRTPVKPTVGALSVNNNPFRFGNPSILGESTTIPVEQVPENSLKKTVRSLIPGNDKNEIGNTEAPTRFQTVSYVERMPAPAWLNKDEITATETVMTLKLVEDFASSEPVKEPADVNTAIVELAGLASDVPLPGTSQSIAAQSLSKAERSSSNQYFFIDKSEIAPVAVQYDQESSVRERLEAIGSPALDSQTTYARSQTSNSPKKERIDWEIAELEEMVKPAISEDFGFRWREGEAGLGQLTEFKLPVSYSITLGGGRLTTTAQPIFLSAGEIGDDTFELRQLGAMASVEPDLRSEPIDDSAGGVGLNFGYEYKGIKAFLGTTPLGFESPNVTAGLSYETDFQNGFTLDAGLALTPVTDSLLSYAGLQDTITGESFGAVTDSRVYIGGSYAMDDVVFYAKGSGMVREGENVDSNSGIQFDGGMVLPLSAKFETGFNVTYFGYEENRRHFSLGHGGYFSPQDFVSATIPLNYTYDSQRFKVEFKNAIGVQFYSEDGASLFPDNPELLADAEAAQLIELSEAPSGTELPLGYDSQSQTNLAAKSSVMTDYKLTKKLSFRTGFAIDRAADWTEFTGQIGLKYTLN